jgi:signal recognition particle subunit SRP54
MFDQLTQNINLAFRRLKGKVTINDQDIKEMMSELRTSLIDADVHVSVIESLLSQFEPLALNEQVIKGVKPADKIIQLFERLIKEYLGEGEELSFATSPTVVMIVGLQGTGKTTQVVKLAKRFSTKKQLLVAADTQRPAAISQLQQLGLKIDVEVYTENASPVEIAKNAVAYAKQHGIDVVWIDTAGRLSIDEPLMHELVLMKQAVRPQEILYVIDAMSGQSALNVAKTFDETLGLTGAIMTKLDGDARGGAALSVRHVVGVPIRYAGLGEKLDEFDLFHGDRLAQRILGMGDVATLVEKAEANMDPNESMRLMEKMMSGTMNYNDMRAQFSMMKRMGNLSSVIGMIPGMSQLKQVKDIDDSQFKQIEVLIDSMTRQERSNPSLIERDHRRRRRIADGAGRKVAEVNRLIQSLEQQMKMAKMMSSMQSGKLPTMPSMQPKKSRGKGKSRRPW